MRKRIIWFRSQMFSITIRLVLSAKPLKIPFKLASHKVFITFFPWTVSRSLPNSLRFEVTWLFHWLTLNLKFKATIDLKLFRLIWIFQLGNLLDHRHHRSATADSLGMMFDADVFKRSHDILRSSSDSSSISFYPLQTSKQLHFTWRHFTNTSNHHANTSTWWIHFDRCLIRMLQWNEILHVVLGPVKAKMIYHKWRRYMFPACFDR